MTTRQYARLVSGWIASIGLDPRFFGTHSLRRTKATLIYRRTGNLRAVQLLLDYIVFVLNYAIKGEGTNSCNQILTKPPTLKERRRTDGPHAARAR